MKASPSNVTLIYYKDENSANTEELIKKLNPSTTLATGAQSVYRISPVIIQNEKSQLVYPSVCVNSEIGLISNEHIKIKEDEKVVKKKYEHSDFDSALKTANYMSNTTKEMIVNAIDLKKPDEDTDTRKFLDKYNLLRGFHFAMDPYNNKSHLEGEDNEGETESDLKFHSLNERLEELFDIK